MLYLIKSMKYSYSVDVSAPNRFKLSLKRSQIISTYPKFMDE